MKLRVEDKVRYFGGSKHGNLVSPSLGNACIDRDMPIINCYHIPNADYPMAMMEYYTHKKIKTDAGASKMIFKLTKTEKHELTI